jgi:hypothetical protein
MDAFEEGISPEMDAFFMQVAMDQYAREGLTPDQIEARKAHDIRVFDEAIADLTRQEACAYCGEDGQKRCSRCKAVKYCSKGCQRTHWAEHKITCKKSTKTKRFVGYGSHADQPNNDGPGTSTTYMQLPGWAGASRYA